MEFLSLVVPKSGLVVSISTKPSATTLQASSVMQRPDNPQIPWYARLFLNAEDSVRQLRASRWNVKYMYWFLQPNGQDLAELTKYVDEGKLVPIVGSRVKLRDMEKVKEACEVIYKGKGGLGKTVIEDIQSGHVHI